MTVQTVLTFEHDKVWAAGFFEGEGSIRISRPAPRNMGSLCVDVPNTIESLVRFFAERWGGSVHRTPAKGRRRPYWRWRCGALQAARFLRDIQPYLRSERYRERAFLALAFQGWKTTRPKGTDRELYRAAQWWFYTEMRTLNARGNDPNAKEHRR